MYNMYMKLMEIFKIFSLLNTGYYNADGQAEAVYQDSGIYDCHCNLINY